MEHGISVLDGRPNAGLGSHLVNNARDGTADCGGAGYRIEHSERPMRATRSAQSKGPRVYRVYKPLRHQQQHAKPVALPAGSGADLAALAESKGSPKAAELGAVCRDRETLAMGANKHPAPIFLTTPKPLAMMNVKASSGGTGCLNWVSPGLWGREGSLPLP